MSDCELDFSEPRFTPEHLYDAVQATDIRTLPHIEIGPEMEAQFRRMLHDGHLGWPRRTGKNTLQRLLAETELSMTAYTWHPPSSYPID